MEIVLLLLPVALLLVSFAVVGFLWAARKGQFDDLETPAIRVLFDDESIDGKGNLPDHQKAEGHPDEFTPVAPEDDRRSQT